MKRRLLAWILVIAMGISCVPLQVFAQEDSGEQEPVLMEATVETTEATEETTEATVDTTEATVDTTEAAEETAEATEEIMEATEELLLPEETDAAEVLLLEETLDVEAPVLEAASDGEVVISGSCGENVYYSLDSEGVMTISGEGDMSEFSTYPWENWRGSITELVVEESVTSIANNAFSSCYYLASVSFPSTLKSIGYDAFSYGWKLYNLVIPASVSSIGEEAFAHRKSLQHISFEHQYNQYLSIGSNAFKAEADATNKQFTTVDVPDAGNVNYYIRNYNWSGDFRKLVGDSYYSRPVDNTITASDITLVVNRTQAQTADINASAKGGAILSYSSDTSEVKVSSSGTLTIAAGYSGTAKITITAAKTAGYKETTRIISVKVASAGTVIDSGFCGDNVTYTLTADGLLTIAGSGPMTNYSSSGGVTTAPWSSNVKRVTKVVVKGSINHIGSSAFTGCSNLTSLSLPDSVTTIGYYAFQRCTSLTSLSLPDSVTEIGSYAFHGCTSLTSVSLPNASIGEQAFCVCTGLTSVTMAPNSADDATRVIGPYAFSGCTKLSELTLPNNISEIKSSAFRSCTALTNVTLPKGLTKLGAQAFINTPISEIVIPASLTTCGITGDNEGPFAGCLKLERATLTDGIRTIPDNLFAGVSYLEYVSIPDTVVTIGANAFYGCSILQSIYFPATTRQIGMAFYPYSPENVYYGGTETKWSTVTVDELNGLPTPQCSHVHNFSHETTTVAGATIYTCDCGGYRNEKQLPLPTEKNTINASDITLTADNTKAQTVSLNASAKGGAVLSYSSGNPSVTVTTAGVVTIPMGFSGTAQITITAAATTEYLETTKVITVTVNPAPVVNADAEIVVGSVKALAGKDITVPVTITKNPGICTYGFQINYDASVLLLEDISEGSLTNGKGRFIKDIDLARATWLSDENVTETGELMTIHFTVLENALEGPTAVSVSLIDGKKSNLANMADQTVSATFTAGSIDVARGILGDVNEDGEVAMLDVSVLNRFVLGKVTLSDTAQKLGDVNHDGEIAMLDVSILNRFVLGKISQLSVASTNVAESADRAADVAEISAASVTVQAAGVAVISAGSVTARAGEMITVPVTITNNPGICTYGFQINYDASVLTLNDISEGLLTNGKGRFIKDIDLARATWLCDENITGTGELLTISFTVKEGTAAGSIPISVSLIDGKKSNLGSADDTVVAADFVSGEVKVPCPNTIYAEDITVTGSNEQDITVPLNATALGNAVLRYQSDDDAVTINEEGVITVSKGFDGTVKITITAKATDKYLETTKIITLTVKPAPIPNTIKAEDIFLTVNEKEDQTASINASALGGAALTYHSDSEDVTVTYEGEVTVAAGFLGTAKITITAAAVEDYLETTKTVTVTVNPLVMDPDVKLMVGSETVYGNESITIPVYLTRNRGISRLTLNVNYDPALLTLDGISAGQTIENLGTFTDAENGSASWTYKRDITTIGQLALLHFSVSENATDENMEARISVSLSGLTNKAGQEKTFTSMQGQVKVYYYSKLYTITYDANGGENAPEAQQKCMLLISDQVPTRKYHKFLGWAEKPDAEEAQYEAGENYGELDKDITLYAVWEYVPSAIVVEKSDIDLISGQSVKLNAYAYPDENAKILFALDDPEDSQYVTLKGNVLTAKNVKDITWVDITATTDNDSAPPADISVTIYPKVTRVDITQDGIDNVLNNKTLTVNTNEKYIELLAVTYPEDAWYEVTWKSSKPSIAEVDYGFVTLHKSGKVTITATAAGGSKKSAKVTLNVVQPTASLEILNAPETLQGGQKFTLKTDIGQNVKGIDRNVTWVLDEDSAAFASVKNGALTTKVVYEPVTIHVTAYATANPEAIDEADITLLPAATAASILYNDRITEKTTVLPLKVGETLELKGGCYPADAYGTGSWKSSSTKIATVDRDGTVKGVKAGVVTITYTFAGKSASVKVQVGNPVTDITISAPGFSSEQKPVLCSGKSMTLKAVFNNDASIKKVTWALANAADSAYCSISSSGKLTAKTVYSCHDVTIKATAVDGTGKTAERTVSILPKTYTVMAIMDAASHDITEKTILLEPNDNDKMKVVAKTDEISETAAWKSSNTKVATIEQSGIITAQAPGTAKITATVGKRTASFTIKVATKVKTITVGVKNNLPAVLMSGKSLNMTALTNKDASNKEVTWSLAYPNNDPKCATISSSSGALKAAAGLTRQTEVQVIATAADGSGICSAPFTVTLYPAATGVNILKAGRVVNGLTSVTDEKETALTAKVYPYAAYQGVTWKSSSTKIAKVDANGKVTFLKAGTVTITATAADGSKKATSFKLTYAPGK